LGITYKSAWFMSHRIREALVDTKPTPMGGKGKSIQADETYYGNSSKRAKHYRRIYSLKGLLTFVRLTVQSSIQMQIYSHNEIGISPASRG
jgi:hypothetical protein